MFEARSAGEQIERDVQHMVRFVVRGVELEDRHGAIDLVAEAGLFDELENHSQSAARNRLRLLGQLVLGPLRPEHRRVGHAPQLIDSTQHPPLATATLLT